MRILTIMMVRNGEGRIKQSLEAMSGYADAIFILDDRSIDRTKEFALTFPKVKNIFSANPDISSKDWYFEESRMLNLLYKMAEFYCPDWVIQLDDDEILQPTKEIREILQSLDSNISGLKCIKISTWDDPDFPLMVPLMGKARQMSGAIWRYYPNLLPDSKPLHNSRLPKNIGNYGNIISCEKITFFHHGWNTLQKRIDKVEKYLELDPYIKFNNGVSYDEGLLFGYKRNSLEKLIQDYRLRYSEYAREVIEDHSA